MRVMKIFDTEAEYEAWVNGPYMRTPYVCRVRETGKTHYFDGDDNDYSVTLVARKTGWFRLFLPSWEEHITIYLNGVEIDPNNSNRFTKGGHYYSKERIQESIDEGTPVSDFEYPPSLQVGDNVKDRGMWSGCRDFHVISDYNDELINKQYNGPEKLRLGHHGAKTRKFMFVNKDDVIKIIFDGINLRHVDLDQYGDNGCTIKALQINDNFFHRGTISWKWAKEIIIGDGFSDISAFRTLKVRKVFLGKNVDTSTPRIYPKDYRKKGSRSRIYCRKKSYGGEFTNFNDSNSAKVITI